jgi:hypothetical protein
MLHPHGHAVHVMLSLASFSALAKHETLHVAQGAGLAVEPDVVSGRLHLSRRETVMPLEAKCRRAVACTRPKQACRHHGYATTPLWRHPGGE